MKLHVLMIFAGVACVVGVLASGCAFGQGAPVDVAKVDAALKQVAAFEFGQSREPLSVVADAVRDSQGNAAMRKDLEQKLLALLKDKTSLDAKDFAVRQLSIIGTDASVPVLAPMLDAKETANLARYALERIPGAAADKALLEGLKRVQDPAIKVGIVNSLGQRKTAEAVGPIAALVDAKDAPLAEAALAALATIGNEAATKALADAKVAEPLQTAWADAYLICADKLAAAGKKEPAAKIYERFNAKCEPDTIRVAAFRGQVSVAAPKAAQEMLLAALTGDNAKLQQAATAFVRKNDNDKAATEAFAAVLPKASPAGQVLLLSALADRGDASALPAVTALASSPEASVRTASLTALGKLGAAASITVLAGAATKSEREERDAARNALDTLRGKDIDAAIVVAMKKVEPPARAELARSLAARNATGTVPALLDTAKDADETVRAESLKALGVLATEKDLPALVDLLASVQGDTARREAEKAVVQSAKTITDEAKRSGAVLAVLPKVEDGKIRGSFYGVLSQLGDAAALDAVKTAVANAKDEEKDAAVRALSEWPNGLALDELMNVAEHAKDDTHQVLALRGVLHLLDMPSDRGGEATMKYYEKAMELAKSDDEKRLVLGALASVKDLGALKLVKPCAKKEELKQEAAVAAQKIRASAYKALASDNAGEAARAIDGKADSRWHSAGDQAPGQWFALDLGGQYRVSKITLDASRNAEDYPRGYQVFVSDDLNNPGAPVAEGKGSGGVTEISFAPKAGHFVKIVQTGSAEKRVWSIEEIKVESDDI